MIQRLGKTAVAAVIIAALSWFVAVPVVHADDDDRSHCRHAVERAEARLDRAIAHHGEHSRAAEERRRDLIAERRRCWELHHQWWNGHEHRWETEQNWDHDHDNR